MHLRPPEITRRRHRLTSTAAPGRRIPALPAAVWILLSGWAALPSGLAAQDVGGASAEIAREASVRWEPATPRQGSLVRILVDPGAGLRVVGAAGRVFGEPLHFDLVERGVLEALAGIPVDADGTLRLPLEITYRDGSTEGVEVSIPLAAGSFEHEELTVAPRYGSPPSEADRRRRARDAARARAVSEAAHETARLWTRDVVIPRRDRVTSGFGNGRVFNGQVSSRHMGLDLDGEPGDTVYAATRGVVELVDEFLLAGNIVYLNHGGGLVSGYFHLTDQLVTPGDTVTAGTPIGLVGATGRVTGPHLHWVVRYGHVSVDPRTLLDVVGGGEGEG